MILTPLLFRKDSSSPRMTRQIKILQQCLWCESTLERLKSVFNVFRRKSSLGAPGIQWTLSLGTCSWGDYEKMDNFQKRTPRLGPRCSSTVVFSLLSPKKAKHLFCLTLYQYIIKKKFKRFSLNGNFFELLSTSLD